jgi:hypothetical protein
MFNGTSNVKELSFFDGLVLVLGSRLRSAGLIVALLELCRYHFASGSHNLARLGLSSVASDVQNEIKTTSHRDHDSNALWIWQLAVLKRRKRGRQELLGFRSLVSVVETYAARGVSLQIEDT